MKTVWLTGLPGSGKTTLAKALGQGVILDGDSVRAGLSKDLSMDREGRREQARRVAEVAKLINDSGYLVVVALVSSYEEDRELARSIIGTDKFIEVYVHVPYSVRKERRPQYIDHPYDIPNNPNLRLDTSELSVRQCVKLIKESLCL